MKCFTASPLRGAILAYVFGGIAIAISVLIILNPFAGTIASYALLKS